MRRQPLLNLLLQLRQQIERVKRGERVQLQLADFFNHRLRQRGKDGKLGAIGRRIPAARCAR